MNMGEARKKYPGMVNLGFAEIIFKTKKIPRPDVDWIPAEVFENFLIAMNPVFSARVDGKYSTWLAEEFKGAEVLGFVAGPYDIPNYAGRPSFVAQEAAGKLVDPQGKVIALPKQLAAVPEEGKTDETI